jgi:release factor glutamine methyltransferase
VGSTVGELLREAVARLRDSGSESALLDAELLLGHALHVDRASVLAHPEAQVGPAQLAAFEAAVTRRATGEPVAYIRGTKEFYGLAFMVDNRALIPRPETELLVELALERLRRLLLDTPRPQGTPPLQVWDVGTGSGAVVISLAVTARRRGYADDLRFLATDASPDALALATENAVGHGVADIIEFQATDLLQRDGPAAGVELIVANLPYIPSAVVPQLPVAASFEPRSALDGGADGLEVIGRFVAGLPAVLAGNGTCLLEIGDDQAERVVELATRAVPERPVSVHLDLGGRPRVVELAPLGRA